MIKIMADIDGVLVDWLGKFRTMYNAKVDRHSEARIMDGDDPILEPMGLLVDYNVKADINGLHLPFVEEVLEEIDEVKGAVNFELVHYLQELMERDDIQIEVVTARTRHLDATYELMKEMGFKDGHIILGMKHKEDIAGKYDIIIDDSPYLAEKLFRLGMSRKVFMPKWSYNWHVRHSSVGGYGTTKELITAIKDRILELRG